MKALVFDRIGAPLDVLSLREVAIPSPGEGEVLIRMSAASINPGDFLYVQNLYPEPKRPVLPGQIAGNHGVGRVERTGPGVTGHAPGTLVAFSYLNSWAEFAVVPQQWLIPLPEGYPLVLGAQLMNLITAWDLLERARVLPGDWLAVTAGYSTVASMVTQMAHARGARTISLVRRKRSASGLPGVRGSHIVETEGMSTGATATIERLTDGRGISAAIDSVGGPLLSELVRSLSIGGRIVIYGGFSTASFELHNFDLLMRVATIDSYAYRYFFDPPQPGHAAELQRIIDLSSSPGFPAQAGGWHRLEAFEQAIGLSVERPEAGKQFFLMQAD